jgi:hypothetical protein
MTRYFIDYYRDFGNTYTVYAVSPADVARFRAAFPDAEPISRARAIDRGWTRVRQAKRTGEQWPAGFADPAAGAATPQSIAEAIDLCREGTQDAIEQTEAVHAGSEWAMSHT